MRYWFSLCLCLALLGTGGPLSALAVPPPAIQASAPADTGHTVPRAVQRLLIQGTVESQLGDYEEAISYLEDALDRAPSAPALLQALADAHAAQGDLSTALFYARKARRNGPDQAYYHRRLAELQRKAGEPQAAVQTYRTLLDRFPDDRAAYRGLAALQAALDRPRAALDTYEQLLAHGARSPVAVYRKMLSLYRRVGNPKGVEETLQALVDHRPNNRRYRRLLGTHYADSNRPEAALNLLAPLAAQRPDDAELQRQVQRLAQKTGRSTPGDSLRPSGDATTPSAQSTERLLQRARAALKHTQTASDTSGLQTADQLLQRILDRSPRHGPALRLQARLHERRGQYARAGAVLKRAVEETPQAPDLWARAAEAYLKAREYETAASVAEEGLLLFPGEVALARTAAVSRSRNGAPKQALDHLQNALNLVQSDTAQAVDRAVLRARLALTHTRLDHPDEARAALEQALDAAPDAPTVLRLCAHTLALRGEQLDRAHSLARSAVDQTSSDPRALHTLGWVQFQQGRLEAARHSLRRALDAGPPTARLLEHFGDVQKALGNLPAARRYWQRALERAPERSSLRKKLEAAPTS